MSTFIGIFLVVCLNATVPGTCTSLPITDNTEAQADDAPLTMTGCMGVEGQVTALKYWEAHPDLHEKFQYGGWRCQVGTLEGFPDRGKA